MDRLFAAHIETVDNARWFLEMSEEAFDNEAPPEPEDYEAGLARFRREAKQHIRTRDDARWFLELTEEAF